MEEIFVVEKPIPRSQEAGKIQLLLGDCLYGVEATRHSGLVLDINIGTMFKMKNISI
jgi:hypothetical protein